MIHRAKKNLGQNFLKSQLALNKMCEAGEVSEEDIVLEIGPGKGALTAKLLEKAKVVMAVEKDQTLVKFLQEKFRAEIKGNSNLQDTNERGKLILIEGDILDFNINDHLEKTEKYKIIANIPYNITGAIFKKFLSSDFQPEKMVLLIQKEVAERIIARDKKESVLSLSVKSYGDPKYIMKVNKKYFTPSPKVDSAIISINQISRKNFKNILEEDNFFRIIRGGFAHKRKVLRKNLENLSTPTTSTLGAEVVGGGKIDKVFKKLQIDPKARAEDLSLEKWLAIYHDLSTEM